MTLEDWGWNKKFEDEFTSRFRNEDWRPGRVMKPGRGIHRLWTQEGEMNARLTGKAKRDALEIAAGDWVAYRTEGGSTVISGILERRTALTRKVPGDRTKEQILAANVDVSFIVQGLGEGRAFTPRGLERYVAMAWESGSRPVILLNKADLSDDPDGDLFIAEDAAPGVDVILCSTVEKTGIDGIRIQLSPRKTAVFVGPSGVGKSSLVNALAGEDLNATGNVRASDRRGRHTTTDRQLRRLSDGRLLLDTPGLRELQLWGEVESADAVFPEIEALADQCRFRDCRHENEPGCAVREGLSDERIDPERFDSWLELRRELAWLESRKDEKAQREYMQKWIDIAKFSRAIKKEKEIW